MDIIKGKDFMFYAVLDGETKMLCHATDFSLSVNTKELETTGPNNGIWDSYIPAGNDYTIAAPGIASYMSPFNLVQLQELQNANTVFEWIAGIDQNGGLQYSGSMFITNINMTTQFRDAVKFDMSARGAGPLQINKNPYTRAVYLANTNGQRLPGCPNPYPVGVLWYDGTFLGVANNADDVITVFNEYSETQGNYLTVVSTSGGCDFVMQIEWNSPTSPTFIPATTGAGFVIGASLPGDVIGESDFNQNVIGA